MANERFFALKKVSTADAIVTNLKERIRCGEFAPGALQPSERELQAQLGVSRLTLREGLARLTALGIIHVHHGKGAFVAEAVNAHALEDVLLPFCPGGDAARMKDLIEARGMVEGEMAARAATRRKDADLARLEALLVCQADQLTDAVAFARRDLLFHREVARISGNAFMTLMHEAICGHVEAFLVQFARAIPNPAAALERHRPILKAIAKGDAVRAREIARAHAQPCYSAIHAKQRKKERTT
jgi:DNA-binding FadR family transcriptional regulator